MKTKRLRFLSLALVFCLALGMAAGVFPAAAKADAPQVQLYYARTGNYTNYEGGYYKQYFYIEGYVCIENSTSAQAVALHYSQAGGAWGDVSASYVRNDSSNYEVWYFRSTPVCGRVNGSPSLYGTWWNLCLKYTVNGTTYWDNNGGNNYYLKYSNYETPTPDVLNKSAITQDLVSKGGTNFAGGAVLKNLAYTKTVGIRYTTDNWATYNDSSMNYNVSIAGNLEVWIFSVTIPSGATVKYCFYYTVNGTTYWDNNFGQNYTV